MRTPLQPNGWPIAMDPPFTFTLVISRSSSLIQARLCDAKLHSIQSDQDHSAVKPARCNAFVEEGTGPIPMIAGSTPATAMLTILATGCRLNSFTASSLASNIAAAPSLIPDELPAVTVPSFAKAGFNALPIFQAMSGVDVHPG
jgi:hypothetical protein